MPDLSKNQRLAIMGVAGAIAVILVYRWYRGRSAQATTPGPTPTDQAASDYASLAGTEQADIAALQGSEQSDIAALQSSIAGLSGTEQADIATLTGQLASASGQEQGDIARLEAGIAGLTKPSTNAVAGGHAKASPSTKPGPVHGLPAAAGRTFASQALWLARHPEWYHRHPKFVAGHPMLAAAAHHHNPRLSVPPAKAAVTVPERVRNAVAHVSAHQAGNAGHVRSHAGGAVAARSHVTRPGATGPGRSQPAHRSTVVQIARASGRPTNLPPAGKAPPARRTPPVTRHRPAQPAHHPPPPRRR